MRHDKFTLPVKGAYAISFLKKMVGIEYAGICCSHSG